MGYQVGIIYGFGFTGRGTMEDIAEVLKLESYEDLGDYELSKSFASIGFDLLEVKDMTHYNADEWFICVRESSGQAWGNQIEGIEEIFDPNSINTEALVQLEKLQTLLEDEFYLGNRVLAWRLFGQAN